MAESPSPITLIQHLTEQQSNNRSWPDALTGVILDIAQAAKSITGEAGTVLLAQGMTPASSTLSPEHRQFGDLADDLIYQINAQSGHVSIMASAWQDGLRPLPEGAPSDGPYALIYDALDGGRNIDVNTSTGMIFAIHKRASNHKDSTIWDVLQPGYKLSAAAYVIFGACTTLVYSAGNGVHGFTFTPEVDDFILSHLNMQMPSPPKIYSTNQGYQKFWTPGMRRYVKWLQGLDDDNRDPLSGRYIGSVVADFHRNLLRGGVFMYPGSQALPAGKLRLTYAVQPLAFIAAQAGGYASDGVGDILSLKPESLYQRVPLFVGDRALVEKAEEFLQEFDHDYLEMYAMDRQVEEMPLR